MREDLLPKDALTYTLYVYMDELLGEQRIREEKDKQRRYRGHVLEDPRYKTLAPLAELTPMNQKNEESVSIQ